MNTKGFKLLMFRLFNVFYYMPIRKTIIILLLAFATMLIMLAAIYNMNNTSAYWFYFLLQLMCGLTIYFIIDDAYAKYYGKHEKEQSDQPD